jgi:HK97 gp10 family phage protein
MFEVKMNGVDELSARLDALTYDLKFKGGRAALRKAAQLVRDAAKQNAKGIDDPETAAAIHKNITERWGSKRFKRTGDLAFRVGVLGGANITKKNPKGTLPGGPGGDTRYWAYVEFGTENTPAQPFMQRALEENAQAATDQFIESYNKAIDRILAKTRKAG